MSNSPVHLQVEAGMQARLAAEDEQASARNAAVLANSDVQLIECSVKLPSAGDVVVAPRALWESGLSGKDSQAVARSLSAGHCDLCLVVTVPDVHHLGQARKKVLDDRVGLIMFGRSHQACLRDPSCIIPINACSDAMSRSFDPLAVQVRLTPEYTDAYDEWVPKQYRKPPTV